MTTWMGYRDLYNAHIIPRVGHMRLQALSRDDLDRLYDELEERGGHRKQGLAPSSVANIHGVMHKALSDAVKRGLLHRNVADAVDAPSPAKGEQSVWTVEQLRVFLEHVRDDSLYAAWLLFATTDMRRGEVAGSRVLTSIFTPGGYGSTGRWGSSTASQLEAATEVEGR